MELQLFRNDITQTATTAPGTLVVLPVGDNKQQKVASGDMTGTVQVYSIKGGQLAYSYKSLPSGQKVTSVTLGKARPQRDKVFMATGSTVRGISKKGKEFFKFATNITEALQRVDVAESHLWLSGEYVHAHFLESKERDFFLAPDKIQAVDLLPLVSSTDHTAVLACKDRMVRLMADGAVKLQAATSSAPTAIKYVAESHDSALKFSAAKEVLVGLESGRLVQLLASSDGIRQGFELPNPKRLGSVWSLYSGIDFTKNGTSDIVVAREDGCLEIYDVDEAGGLQQVYSAALGESINTVDGGFIVSPVSQDCLVQTFSGKVIAFSTSGVLAAPADAFAMKRMAKSGLSTEDAALKLGLEARVAKLRAELDEARLKVEEERGKMSKTTDVLVASGSTHTLVDRLRLDSEEGCHTLSVESAVPIFTLALQCSLPLQLLDVPSNVAILSRSPPDEKAGSLTLATYRCQENTSRLHVKFQAQEGKAGLLHVYVIPQTSPKTCQVVRHQLKPLCLHQRTQKPEEGRPYSELGITGTFSLEQMHGWFSSCLPDVPANVGRGETVVSMTFSHVLIGSQLLCKYSAGEAKFSSDSFTTLSLLREALMKEISAANERVGRMGFQCHPTGLPHAVGLLWPKLQAVRGAVQDLRLAEALNVGCPRVAPCVLVAGAEAAGWQHRVPLPKALRAGGQGRQPGCPRQGAAARAAAAGGPGAGHVLRLLPRVRHQHPHAAAARPGGHAEGPRHYPRACAGVHAGQAVGPPPAGPGDVRKGAAPRLGH